MIGTHLADIYRPMSDELTRRFKEYILEGQYIGGRYSTDFESKISRFLGAADCVGCKSGTHSLVLALKAAGVGPGDEVISVGNTYYATIWAIKEVGATPVFCEISPDNASMDPNCIESLITPRTKAILPVHLYGIPCDLDRIKAICQRHCLHLIEDASHAFGSKYKGRYIGADSEFACFSLYPTKNLGAFGDSGIVVSSKKNDADKVRNLLYFSRDPLNGTFNEDAIHAQMDSLQAALISVVLDHFTQMASRRKYLAKLYADTLDGYVQFLPQLVSENVVPYMFCIYADNRDKLSAYLKKRGVATQVHYRYDLHHFKQFATRSWSLPYTEWHNAHVLSLHISPDLGDEDAHYICETVLSYFK